MTPEDAAELQSWLHDLWKYVLDQSEQITVLGEWIAELQARLPKDD
jgi:hypothetical protein